MVRKYIRKTERKLWTEDAMRAAIKAVINAGCSIKKAAVKYKIPHATLSRKINQCRQDPSKQEELLANPRGVSAQRVFTQEQEALLCKYIEILQNQLVDLNSLDIRRLAYNFAERFSISHRFKRNTEMAGDDWYRGFIKRNPYISIKKTDSTDIINGAKNKKINKFFDILKSVINIHKLKASDIYSIDEAVVTCLSSAESDNVNSVNEQKLVTSVICFSANGTFVPLMLILPSSKRISISHQNEHMRETWTSFNSTGQMQLEIFIEWLNKFIKFSKASKNSPVLLLVDGYRSYLKNLKVLEIAENNGVKILCLPFNCTSKLQPIQHNFMKMLSKAYASEILILTNTNPAQSITTDKVYHLFKDIFSKISLMQNIPVDSFRETGIWPLNKSLFEEFILEKDDKCNLMEYKCNGNNSPCVSELMYAATEAEVLYENCDKATNEEHETIVQIHEGSFNAINKEADESFNRDIASSIFIPPEAKLTAVTIEDLYSFIHNQQQFYFYVSPYKLNLPS